jgi:hypothetical protein
MQTRTLIPLTTAVVGMGLAMWVVHFILKLWW